jgi:hypothetical protein
MRWEARYSSSSAAQGRYYPTVAALLENAYIDIDAVNTQGNTALIVAVQMNLYSNDKE